MRITVFTSNQPRHLSLIESLSTISSIVYAVQECTTVFPGEVDDFYTNSPVMKKYFHNVRRAERSVFGKPRFISSKVRQLALKSGDLNRLDMRNLGPALESDAYIVFGSSFIKGALCDFLVGHNAFNIHMGTSPYYRGSSCNFWALYDGRPDYVGATIHKLTSGLDSGPILFHAFPKTEPMEPFLLGMLAVQAAHFGLRYYLATGAIWKMKPIKQDKKLEMRYSRKQDFTDEIVQKYFRRQASPKKIFALLKERDMSRFLRPVIYSK